MPGACLACEELARTVNSILVRNLDGEIELSRTNLLARTGCKAQDRSFIKARAWPGPAFTPRRGASGVHVATPAEPVSGRTAPCRSHPRYKEIPQ